MGQARSSTFSSTVGFFGYLLGHALLCIPLLLWAFVDHAGRAAFARLGVRLDPEPGS